MMILSCTAKLRVVAWLLLVGLAVSAPLSAQNQALRVDGNNSALRVPKHPSLEPAQAITVECWIRGLGSVSHGRIVRKEAGSGYMVSWSFQGNKLSGLYNCSGIHAVYDTKPVSAYLDAWPHLAWTAEAGGVQRLYVDGALVAQAPGPPCLNHSGDLWFGADNGLFEEFNGWIDEVRIWNVARTPEQIAATWNTLIPSAPGLVSVWHLDGNGLDAIGSNHGTLFGGATFEPAPELPWAFVAHPARADWSGGSTIFLTGNFGGLPGVPDVRFGGVSSPEVLLLSSHELQVTVPPGAAPGIDVPITLHAGELVQHSNVNFTYTPSLRADSQVAAGERLAVDLRFDPPANIAFFAGTRLLAGSRVGSWSWLLLTPPELRIFAATAPLQDELSFRMPLPAELPAGGFAQIVLQALVLDSQSGLGGFSNATVVTVSDASP